MKLLFSYFIFSMILLSNSVMASEHIVLIGGIDSNRVCSCGIQQTMCSSVVSNQNCTDKEYLGAELTQSIINKANTSDLNERVKVIANDNIKTFYWSGDPVEHGEDLKGKFERWFKNHVCGYYDTECVVSFVAHSWGTIILADFIAHIPSNSDIRIRNIALYTTI